uniref:DNA (cytosine-5-)-methyltransferase n=1 Tax=viral metagenome TaxID=1070528 RepID=A0A6C0LLH6_9ZZZZ
MPINAISLFSGMGGDTLGMKDAGIKVVGFVEINQTFCNSHNANFPNSTCIGNDITKIEDEKFKVYKDKVDLIFSGAPCQSFSNAGKKDPKDKRGYLYQHAVRATKLIEPKYIMIENVKGLLSRKMPDKKLFIDVIKEAFEELGYHITYKVLKANDYGVPQKRERLIILGCRDKPLTFPELIDTKPNLKNIVKFDMIGAIKITKDDFDFTTIPEKCILKDEDNDDEEDTENVHPYLKLKAKSRDIEYNEKVHHTLLSFAKRDSPIHCEIIDIRKPSKTIICTYDHQPRLFVPLKNKNGYYLRCLLPDELKQIQGFPPDYIVSGNKKEKVIQIGNAVPPPLIKIIVEHIIS